MTPKDKQPYQEYVDLGACLEGIYDRSMPPYPVHSVDLSACLEQVLLAVNF